ncbi:MAG: transporter substrate-binding domain-containing protein [Bacteroidales bacterium]|nr:MAG: transporter substrate-binding domain-containing protein [Bacteroidales bacterium]
MKESIIKIILLIFLFLSSGIYFEKTQDMQITIDDLDIIKDKGKIVVLTDFNSTSYFIYRGQPMGYQYELLQELADHFGLGLEVIVSNDLNNSFDKLESGEVDLIAANLTITKQRKKIMDFTTPHSKTRQVLVQRKPDNWESLDKKSRESVLIRDQLDLAGKTVYVQANSSHAFRLKNLSDEIGENINIIETKEEVEQLISLVASGEIDYAVSDENVAQVNQSYYQNIDVETPVSFHQNLAWAVRNNSGKLLTEINNWLEQFKNTRQYKLIYAKYFQNNRSANIVESDYYALASGRISAYDEYIKKYSEEIGWDWKLIASLMYQESRFQPNVRSWAGAFGLMQFMPATASRFGISPNSSNEQQIRAGVKFLMWLEQKFDNIEDRDEKIKFTLAAYNVGLGHIIDARNLAEKNGSNPDIWDNSVDNYLLSKSDPEFYNDPVVKYGYCRGKETYAYVRDIMERYEHYRNLID